VSIRQKDIAGELAKRETGKNRGDRKKLYEGGCQEEPGIVEAGDEMVGPPLQHAAD